MTPSLGLLETPLCHRIQCFQLCSIPKRSISNSGLHIHSGFDIIWPTFLPYLCTTKPPQPKAHFCSLQRATHHRPTISRIKLKFIGSHIRIPYSLPSLINRINAISAVKRLSLSVSSLTPPLAWLLYRSRSPRSTVNVKWSFGIGPKQERPSYWVLTFVHS